MKLGEIRTLLSAYEHKTISSSSSAFAPIAEVLRGHLSWADQIERIRAVRVTRSRANGALLLQLALHTGKRRWFTISWRKCAVPGRVRQPDSYPTSASIYEALRQAVRYQTRRWRSAQPRMALRCAECQSLPKGNYFGVRPSPVVVRAVGEEFAPKNGRKC